MVSDNVRKANIKYNANNNSQTSLEKDIEPKSDPVCGTQMAQRDKLSQTQEASHGALGF